MARMPKGMSHPRFTGTPALRISSSRARFSSSRTSCFFMMRLFHHNFASPIQKTITMAIASTYFMR
jgi:hypothetical protein